MTQIDCLSLLLNDNLSSLLERLHIFNSIELLVLHSIKLNSIHAGNLVDWWDPATMQKYIQKAQCIIEQYGNYTIPELGLSLNGINTQGENIADNGGIKEAYRAYSKFTSHTYDEFMTDIITYLPSSYLKPRVPAKNPASCDLSMLNVLKITTNHEK